MVAAERLLPEATSERGHDSPRFAPNLLMLLFDHGVTPGDDPRIGRLLDQMLDHHDDESRLEVSRR